MNNPLLVKMKFAPIREKFISESFPATVHKLENFTKKRITLQHILEAYKKDGVRWHQ